MLVLMKDKTGRIQLNRADEVSDVSVVILYTLNDINVCLRTKHSEDCSNESNKHLLFLQRITKPDPGSLSSRQEFGIF